MRFMEMTGKTLDQIVSDDELNHSNLEAAGVEADTIVRINEHGDIEVRRPARWDVIGGLLGDYVDRVKVKTGLDWV
ncbi:MAG: hypothetical protein H8E66_26730 [Planctomycetes bacterium]|nr:hypothetical protein [Planctomycetota bacterium]